MSRSDHLTATAYLEIEFEIEFDYRPATPDVWYLPNGDPGYPGDPEEIETTEVCVVLYDKDGKPHRLPVPNEWLQYLDRHFEPAMREAIDDLDNQEPHDVPDSTL